MQKKLWSINGKIWHRSGDMVYLPQGDYSISFSNVKNYQEPQNINVSIVANKVQKIIATYEIVESGINTSINIAGLTNITIVDSDLLINNLNGNITI